MIIHKHQRCGAEKHQYSNSRFPTLAASTDSHHKAMNHEKWTGTKARPWHSKQREKLSQRKRSSRSGRRNVAYHRELSRRRDEEGV